MIRVYRELEGSMRLAAHVLRRCWVLRLPPVAEEFARQIYFFTNSGPRRDISTIVRRCAGVA